MTIKRFFQVLDKAESYICQALLSFFVIILFLQIFLRVCFNYVIPWSEEISRFSFVWFVFFGAAYAARLAAHNRVTIQFKLLPACVGNISMFVADIIWVAFNIIMIVKSVQVVKDLGEFTFYSPALGWSMEYVYWVFPMTFALMTLRIVQVNIMKYVLKIEIEDVDKVDPDEFKDFTEDKNAGGR